MFTFSIVSVHYKCRVFLKDEIGSLGLHVHLILVLGVKTLWVWCFQCYSRSGGNKRKVDAFGHFTDKR